MNEYIIKYEVNLIITNHYNLYHMLIFTKYYYIEYYVIKQS